MGADGIEPPTALVGGSERRIHQVLRDATCSPIVECAATTDNPIDHRPLRSTHRRASTATAR
ncbi:hypothetical protein A4G29_02700 [Mycobacterium kansasii]|nr:hypothetical protein A4G29_02700 [Mycobacterium kansasii]